MLRAAHLVAAHYDVEHGVARLLDGRRDDDLCGARVKVWLQRFAREVHARALHDHLRAILLVVDLHSDRTPAISCAAPSAGKTKSYR